jgi:molecular chaperone DnaK
LVSRLLEERLNQPAHQEVNPDLCVAMGAAIQGAIVAGQDVGAVLVDITPHSLGIRTVEFSMGYPNENRFSPILHRNTPLPASRSEVYATLHDGQEAVDVEVFQGENDDVRYNHRIGRFKIEGLAKLPAGNQVLVQLDLNLDGILKVSAKEKATGLQKQITIENALANFQGEGLRQARERVDELWHSSDFRTDDDYEPLEDGNHVDINLVDAVPQLVPGPREGQRETVQARALIEKAERMLDRLSAEDRNEVQRLVDQVRNQVVEQAWDRLEASTNQLSDVLFYLEE